MLRGVATIAGGYGPVPPTHCTGNVAALLIQDADDQTVTPWKTISARDDHIARDGCDPDEPTTPFDIGNSGPERLRHDERVHLFDPPHQGAVAPSKIGYWCPGSIGDAGRDQQVEPLTRALAWQGSFHIGRAQSKTTAVAKTLPG